MKHPILDMSAVGLFVSTYLGYLPQAISITGSALLAFYYAMLIYDRIVNGKISNRD